MRFRFLTLALTTGTLFAAYACGDEATVASPSRDAGSFIRNDASAAGSGGSPSQSDGSAPLGGSNGMPDAAPATDGGSGDASVGNDAAPGDILIDGDGFGVVYSAESAIGIDSRQDCSATFDADGNLIGYDFSPTEQLALGDATLQSNGTDGHVAWGTWVGGPTTGVFYANTTGEFTFGSDDDGFHYAVGKTATTLPTGVVSYELAGGSEPTLSTGTMPGSIDSATISIDYDSGVDGFAGVAYPVGVEVTVTTEAGTTTYQTTGGASDLSTTEGSTYGMTFFANVGMGSLRGIIVDDGEALAVSYVFNQGTAGDGGVAPRVRGAAALVRQ